ncbi:unnamed protein product [Meloidogyne enterolobii]|uniref:Uncharacterized protein n=1 Tax=Meloidogyne enterolobii TaxID=390850 RepID=A0ACB0YWB1_MELEN
MFKEFGFPDDALSCVKEQAEPDPDVPTASSLDVLKLCYQTAEETGATFILANDADANRLQIAERQPDGDWYLFNGNEMGTLLTWWIWTQWKQQNPNLPGEDFYVINGAFSSHIVAKMAKIEGFKNDVSLTGFKYFGNRAHELRTKGKLVILAWEESIGFATGTTLDKSETSAVAVFAEMANYLASQKLNMKKQLLNICNKYGLYLNTNIIYSNPVRTGTRINVGGNIYSFLFKFSTKFTWYCTLHSNPQIKCTGSIHTYKKNNNNIIIIGTEHNNACISKKNSTQFTLNNTFPPQQQDLSSNISENGIISHFVKIFVKFLHNVSFARAQRIYFSEFVPETFFDIFPKKLESKFQFLRFSFDHDFWRSFRKFCFLDTGMNSKKFGVSKISLLLALLF